MTMPAHRRSPAKALLRFAMACLLGVATAVLVSCGSSGKGLIPAADAGPLQSDFEAVATDAHEGNGNCSATEAAILQTEHDFGVLPPSIDQGLRERLQAGIKNLRERALELCAQPSPSATATSTSPRTTTTQTTSSTPTVTQTTSSQSTSTTTAPTTTSTGGGTPAPSESGGASGPANGGAGAGNPGGAGPREGGPGPGSGEQAGGQEGAR